MRQEIVALQKKMREHQIDYYIVFSEDDHNSEYVAAYYRVRELLSGFTGSAGRLLVTDKDAFLWTDGRYFIQAEQQLAGSGIQLMKMGVDDAIPVWLEKRISENETVGFDGRTVSAGFYRELKEICDKKRVAIQMNYDLAGIVAEECGLRESLEFHAVKDYPVSYAGESREEKCNRLRVFLKEHKKDGFVMTELSEIAWLLNIRGDDVQCNPVALAYLLATKEEFYLYCELDCIEESLKLQLEQADIVLCSYESFYADVQTFSGTLCADERACNALLFDIVIQKDGCHVLSPILEWKATKNDIEVAGERSAHHKDAVAMIEFLYWLKHRPSNEQGELLDEDGRVVTEISAAKRLELERKRQEHYVEPSFDPIVAYGNHGAIVHYSATEETNCSLKTHDFVLMDTGAQFLEGTTDITRTIALGSVDEKRKQLYTAVLKGHFHLLHAVFAAGSRGENIDILARAPLYKLGYDFNHGTGHGVGCYLNVHEGPVSIRSKIFQDGRNSAVLKPGMITSNEPGVYLENEFGIRLENMMVCVEKEITSFGRFLTFEVLTMVPFDVDAIAFEQLTMEEGDWIAAYHEMIYEEVKDELSVQSRDWLASIVDTIKTQISHN